MKTITTTILFLFGFLSKTYSQDIFKSSQGGVIKNSSSNSMYKYQTVFVNNHYFPQIVNFSSIENCQLTGNAVLYKRSKYNICSKLVYIDIQYSKSLEFSSNFFDLDSLIITFNQCYNINLNGIYSNFSAINNDNKTVIDSVNTNPLDSVYNIIFSSENNKINPNFTIQNSKLNEVEYSGDIDRFVINSSTIKKLSIDRGSIKNYLEIINTKIEAINFSYLKLPDTIFLNNLDLSEMKEKIDLTHSNLSDGKKLLILGKVDIEKLLIPFTSYTIKISDKNNYEDQIILYQTVIKKLRELGLNEKAEVLDKEYQELHYLHNNNYITNFISKKWWNYGYDKPKVVINSFRIFFIFFLLNLLFFNTLQKVYLPENIKIYYNRINQNVLDYKIFKLITLRMAGVLLYTAFIFWGLKLDVKELVIKKWWAIILIVFEYSIGVVCLAYIANFIITK